ncbi:MAG TPA: ATP-binding cassette domain-containing protein [Acidimicrobiales bacterium]|nr:ATP-binding cassette domain-containing protein [Acidimicrobiales bacterium]
MPIVRNLNLHVNQGEVVALLGPNGAGKTTTILAIAGELKPQIGTVELNGHVTTSPLFKRAKAGFRLITEERSVFMTLTVWENLRLSHKDFSACLDLFPELKPLLGRKAGLLSGGEQQMLTLARALVGGCSCLLADELSLGLAPLASERLLAAVRAAAEAGTAVLLVEQNLERALKVADRAYVLQRGRVVMEGDSTYITDHKEDVINSYLSAAPILDE